MFRWPKVLQVLLTALAYFLAGRLALLLAIPPGYATAVWPAAGIALASMLMFGYRVWPGVMIGSFCVNFTVPFDSFTVQEIAKSSLLPAIIGAGAALQGFVAAFLTNRMLGRQHILEEGCVIKFLTLTGPACCIISPSVGISALTFAGVVPTGNALYSWMTWWTGDTIGTIVFSPLILIWTAQPKNLWRQRRLFVSLPICATFGLVVLLFIASRNVEQRDMTADGERRANVLTLQLERTLTAGLGNLHSIESLFSSQHDVERKQFHVFVQHLLLQSRAIQALSWVPYVTDEARSTFESQARRDGDPDFQFTEMNSDFSLTPARHRSEYFPVTYIEPLAENEKALGFDLSSDPTRLEAIKKARESGTPTATRKITLVQGEIGFIIALPVYKTDPPSRILAEKRADILGFVTGVFVVNDLIESSFSGIEREGVRVTVYDILEGEKQILYGSSDEKHKVDESVVTIEKELEIANRRWMLQFTLGQEYLAAHRSLHAWSTLAGGMLFAGLLQALLLVITGRTSRVELEVAQTTAGLRRANEILRNQEKQLAEAQQIAHLGSWEWDVGTNAVTWSDELYRIFGLARKEFEPTYQGYLSCVHPADRDHVKSIIEQSFASGESFSTEERIIRADGTLRHLFSKGHVITDEAGRPIRLIGICQDITEWKQALEELRETEARYRTIAQAVPDLLFRFDENGVLTDYNGGGDLTLSSPAEMFLGSRYEEIFPDDVSTMFTQAIRSTRLDGEVKTFECHLSLFSDRTSDYEARIVAIGSTETLCILRNISDEKRAKERFRRLVEFAPDGIIIVSGTGIVQMANPAMLEFLGTKDHTQVFHQSIMRFIPAEEAENWAQLLRLIAQNKLGPIQIESKFMTLNDEQTPVEINAGHCEWDGNAAVQMMARDITERKRAEEKLNASHRYAKSIIDCSTDMIIAVDTNRRVAEFNRAAQKEFGYSAEEVLGKHVDVLYADPTSGVELHRSMIEEGGGTHEVLNKRKTGEAFTSLLSASPLHDANGKLVGMMGVSRDITERKQIEKMKNEFISTVSHELRTPLTSIVASLELLRDGAAEGTPTEAGKLIDVAYESSDRLVRLVNDILDIEKIESGNMVFDFKPTKLIPVVKEAIEGIRQYGRKHGVEVRLENACPDMTANIDTDRVIQVMTNLLSNAIRFSPPQSDVQVSVTRSNGKITVAVSDQGPGIPKEFHARIFQKFAQADASDSRKRGGTGLGLAISKAIVERLGGQITFETKDEEGTTFSFDLPEWRSTHDKNT